MKCVKKGGVIKRVTNKDAERMVGYGPGTKLPGEGWRYVSKDAWRKANKEKSDAVS